MHRFQTRRLILLVVITTHYSDCSTPPGITLPPALVLAGGDIPSKGRVEIYTNGSYGAICSYGWNFNACSVVCRLLGYRLCYDYERFATFGTSSYPMVTDGVDCSGYETSLSDCTNGESGDIAADCYSRVRLAGVRCRDTVLDIRLVNGQNPNEGRVELFNEGEWGAVCDYGWDINDGMVACRQVGYTDAIQVYSGSMYGSDNTYIHVKQMQCLGTEATLSDCLHHGIGRSGSCNEHETAGVLCSDVLLGASNDVIELVDDITTEQYPALVELADDESKYFTMEDVAEGVIIKSSSSTIDLTPITADPNGIAFSLEATQTTNETIGIIAAKLNSVNLTIPLGIGLTDSYIASDLVSINVYTNGRNTTRHVNTNIVYPSVKITEEIDVETMEPVCAFIDEAASPITWSREGCQTISDDYLTSPITCVCDHLTSFAILMQTKTNDNVEQDAADIGLDVMTFVGLSISNLFLFFTISIICTFSDLRKSRRYIMLRHLVVSLLCTNFCFSLLSIDVENKIACSIIAACLHYCLLVAFSWMTILSTDMYMCIQHAFLDPERRFLFFRIFGWMFPLLYVVITASITGENYASESCWLNVSNGVTWSFIGPVMFTILVVTIQLCVVGYVAYSKSQAIQQNDDEKNKLKQIKTLLYRILLLTPAVGLTWIFGIITLFHSSVVLQYLFVFTSSMQGFMIWLTQCFLSKEVNAAWKKFKIQHMFNSIDASSEAAQTIS